MTINEARAHIGYGVIYNPAHGKREDGEITSVSATHAFVRYSGDQHSKATDPADLELLGARR